jgi:hypothetical protein
VFVRKDGTVHLGIDYQQLNKATINNSHQLPQVNDLFYKINLESVLKDL